jgi:hypothetical protein
MSFWSMSDGTTATGNVTENDFAPVPKGWYPSMLEEVSKNEYQGTESVQVKARLENNRVLFLKLKCWDVDSKKRDRAINVLVAIANSVGVALPNGEPDDRWLAKLTDKRVELMVDVWDFEGKQGNWLVNARAIGKAAPVPTTKQDKVADDDIPF